MTASELEGFSLLLVDDHPLFREGLVLALNRHAPELTVAAVSSFDQALERLRQAPQAFDLVLLDYFLPGQDGLKCAAELRTNFPDAACALLSGAEDPDLPKRAQNAGLCGFFHKSLEVERLVAGLRHLAHGELFFDNVNIAPREVKTEPTLSARQHDIVKLVAQGASNKQIAQILGLSPHTVKNHMAQILERLGANNRAQAALMAYEQGDD